MEAPVHYMRTVLPALAQCGILDISVKVHMQMYICTCIYMVGTFNSNVYTLLQSEAVKILAVHV